MHADRAHTVKKEEEERSISHGYPANAFSLSKSTLVDVHRATTPFSTLIQTKRLLLHRASKSLQLASLRKENLRSRRLRLVRNGVIVAWTQKSLVSNKDNTK